MMDNEIRLLQKNFKRIKDMEYVKSVRKGNTGIGATFEYLLGKEEENFSIPDYYGIEIKTRRSYSKAYITLFSAVPTGTCYYEVKRLRDRYGYRDPKDARLKQLNVEIFANKLSNAGIKYYFELQVDRVLEKIFLYVYDRKKNLIDGSTYWDFDILKEKLYGKLQVLALVKAWTNRIGGYEYFKYYKMNIYILKSFDYFIDLIDKGIIKIDLKIGSYHDEKRYGMVSSHGVSFCIKEDDLLYLFDLYR